MASEAGHVQGEGLLCGYDSDTFLDGIIEMPIFQRPQNCWPQWPRRSYEVIWGRFVKNSCLTFLKGLDYILIDFMGIDYLMASEAGHVQREGLLRGYDSETFLDGTIELPFL